MVSTTLDGNKLDILSHELLVGILDILTDQELYGTILALVLTCKRSRRMFGAALEPIKLVLDSSSVAYSFRGIIGLNFRLVNDNGEEDDEHERAEAAEAAESSATSDLRRNDSTTPTIITHLRAVKRLLACRHLTVSDIRGVEALIEVCETVGRAPDSGLSALPNLECLKITAELLWELSLPAMTNRHLIGALGTCIRPRHVCFTMHVGDRDATLAHMRDTCKLHRCRAARSCGVLHNIIWENHYQSGPTGVIQELVETWCPRSVTIHDITVQDLPGINTPQTRFFFSRVEENWAESKSVKIRSKVERCDELGGGLLAVTDTDEGERFEIIGLDDDGEDQMDGFMAITMLPKRSAEEMTLRSIAQRWVRDLLERTVTYMTVGQAKACGVCGGK